MVERHGSESYFVIGEGLLSDASSNGAGDASRARMAVAAGPTAPQFRFSRMGPNGSGKQLGDPALRKLAQEMAEGGGGPSRVPSGYTYLGQFVDHDLTFDKTTVTLGTAINPAMLLQARSPSLDLDSLYGAGPQDADSARFYEPDLLHLRLGKTVAVGGDAAMDGFDLPRGAGANAAAKRKAIIPDPRNDENLVVASTHLAFIRFHNRVVDSLPAALPAAQRFARARELVTKHYQWMLRHDFLPRLVRPVVVNDVFRHGRKAFETGVSPTAVPTMPIEFSVAAYRLGHSMVRPAYNWNARFDNGAGTLDFLFLFTATSGDLGGGPRLPSNWIADFRRLYDFKEAGHPALAVPTAKFNRAMRIDTRIAHPLANLPTGSFGGPAVPFNDPHANLAFRNLERGKMVKLATGQQMARFLKNKGVTLTTVPKAKLRDGNNGAALDRLTAPQRDALLTNTPLWFYVLREAELNAGKLDGVGARIVSETFHRAMEGSAASIVRDPGFRPTFGPDPDTFGMADLLFFAFEGKKQLLAPLG